MSENYEFVDEVLAHLQGYVVESDNESEDILSDLEYDMKISEDTVLTFHRITKSYILSYLNRDTLPYTSISEIIDEEVVEIKKIPVNVCTAWNMWCAGLIWNKYDVRSNNQTDETNTLGYGDKLIIQAKEMLKPFKFYDLKVY